MSLLVNTLVAPGDAITAAALNTKNDNIATVLTDGVDDRNVRHEGLDLPQFARSQGGQSGIITVRAEQQTNGCSIGAGTAYPMHATVNFLEISHNSGTRLSFGAGGVDLEPGDIIRCYFGVFVDEITATPRWPTSAYRQNPCWLVYMQWDTTSNALANWDAPPKQTDFTTVFTDGPAPLDAVGGETEYDGGNSGTHATIPIEHLVYASPTAGPVYVETSPDSTSRFRSYYYKNTTGSTITVYGLRLVVDGLYYPWYTAGEPKNRFCRVEADTDVGDEIMISTAYVQAIIQRTA